jgi:hypothetical protein
MTAAQVPCLAILTVIRISLAVQPNDAGSHRRCVSRLTRQRLRNT